MLLKTSATLSNNHEQDFTRISRASWSLHDTSSHWLVAVFSLFWLVMLIPSVLIPRIAEKLNASQFKIPWQGSPCDFAVQFLVVPWFVQAHAVGVSRFLSESQALGCLRADENLSRPYEHDPKERKNIKITIIVLLFKPKFCWSRSLMNLSVLLITG